MVAAKAESDEFNLTHYYVFEDGKSAIYMGTYTVDQPSVGELRYIARLVNLPQAYKEGKVSDTAGGETVEGSDVFLVNGETRSKVCKFDGDVLHELFLSGPISFIPLSALSTMMGTVPIRRTALFMRAFCLILGRVKSLLGDRSSGILISIMGVTTTQSPST